jgi:hypothetical protein
MMKPTPSLLTRLALAGLVLLACAWPTLAALTVSGTVFVDHSGGGAGNISAEPLAGVLVSDGHQVVRTDALGHYVLPLPESGALIRLSIPSGYWPRDNHWFQRVPAVEGAVCDFPLNVREETSPWYMVQVTDIHYMKPAARHVRVFCGQVNALKTPPAFVMSTGDLVMESNHLTKDSDIRPLFTDYFTAMAGLHAPLFNLPGNHDLAGVTGHMSADDPLYGLRGYEALVGPAWYSFNYAGVHVLALDASLIYGGHVHGGFCPECLAWLRADLERTPLEQPLLIFLHQNAASWDNPGNLQEALAGRKVLGIFGGHTHKVRSYTWAGYQMHEGGALCGRFWVLACADGSPRGFSILKITPDSADTRYVVADSPNAATLGFVRRSLNSPSTRTFLGWLTGQALRHGDY